MYKLITIIILCLFYFSLKGQESPSPIAEINVPFSELYYYDDSTQCYNYSKIWDFDGDKIKDSLFFIGNGGAHLYFYPRIILSSTNKTIDFNSFWLDMPYPHLKKDSIIKHPAIQFSVDDFTGDGTYEIYLNIAANNGYPYHPYPDEWKKLGISTTYILIDFINGLAVLKDYDFK